MKKVFTHKAWVAYTLKDVLSPSWKETKRQLLDNARAALEVEMDLELTNLIHERNLDKSTTNKRENKETA